MTPPELDEADDDALAAALRDLGPHLDVGPDTIEDRAALVAAVVARIDGDAEASGALAGRAVPPALGARRRRSSRLVLAAAVVLVVALVGLLAAPTTREAIAGWFGLGAVEITRSDTPPPTDGLPDRSAPAGEPGVPVDLDAVAAAVPFPVRVADPAVAGEPLSAAADPAVPSGLVEIRYRGFTLVQVASRPGGSPTLSKAVGPGTTITAVTVGDRPGYWITGDPHQVAYVRPDGTTDVDSVRRAGDVLLWTDAGVTYRIEGAASLDAARAVATSLR